MKVRVDELSPIEKRLSVEVEGAKVAQELDRAYQLLSRQVKIAGFRPGKVPRRILEQRFKEQVEDDVIQRVVERAYLEAVREHGVEAVAAPRVTNDRIVPNAPFTFEARVEVKPKVTAKDYRGLSLPRKDATISDAAVEEELERLRQGQATLEPVTDRDVAQAGDFAVIDYEATSEGAPFPGGSAHGTTVEIAEGELTAAKVAALAGVKVGDKAEVDTLIADDHRLEALRGKTAHFVITLKELKTRKVPALDDALAQASGLEGVTTLGELRAKVREQLEQSAASKAKSEEREAILKGLVERNTFDVPTAMVERAVQMMLEGGLRAIARGGIDPRQLGLDFERLAEEMRPKALLEVKAALLLEAIAEQEALTVSDDELGQKVEAIAEESGQRLEVVKKHFASSSEREGLVRRLREEKTLEFLKAQATYS